MQSIEVVIYVRVQYGIVMVFPGTLEAEGWAAKPLYVILMSFA